MMSSKWHKWCGWLGDLLWAAAALSLIFAWSAFYREVPVVFGIEVLAWYWNALVLGVLALGAAKWDCKGAACMVCAPEEKGGEM